MAETLLRPFDAPAENAEPIPHPVKFVSFPVADRTELRDDLADSNLEPQRVEKIIGDLVVQDMTSRQKDVDNYKELIGTQDELYLTKQAKEEQSNILARVERESRLDTLTGLYNRRYFENHVNKLINAGKRFSVLLLDLDGFKQLNDTSGHNAGDDVLRTVGSTLRSIGLRDGDVVVRLGGDEFAIVSIHAESDTHSPDDESDKEKRENKSDKEARLGHIERIDTEIQKKALEAQRNNPKQVEISISAGATDHIEGETYEELMRRVDNIMYDAKTSKKAFKEVKKAKDGKVSNAVFAELDPLDVVKYRGEMWKIFDTKNLERKIEGYFAKVHELTEDQRQAGRYRTDVSSDVKKLENVFNRFGKDHPGIWDRLERLTSQKEQFIDLINRGANNKQLDYMEWLFKTEVERKVLLTYTYGYMARTVIQNKASHPEDELLQPKDLL